MRLSSLLILGLIATPVLAKDKKPVDPNKHSKDELVAMAGGPGVEIKASATKAEIAEAINKARAPKE